MASNKQPGSEVSPENGESSAVVPSIICDICVEKYGGKKRIEELPYKVEIDNEHCQSPSMSELLTFIKKRRANFQEPVVVDVQKKEVRREHIPYMPLVPVPVPAFNIRQCGLCGRHIHTAMWQEHVDMHRLLGHPDSVRL